ncbi:hypothetical protein ATO4_26055 [Aurantimonas sp. 22II-16-19i]|nr:hypothetical protein ATO4_26055 [Aurantimonas sp. 22II-16-19i]
MSKEISFERSGAPADRPRRLAAETAFPKRHPWLRLWRDVLAKARDLLVAHKARLRIRRDEQRLRQMSDFELRDIGLQHLPGGHFGRIPPDQWTRQPSRPTDSGSGMRPYPSHAPTDGVERR